MQVLWSRAAQIKSCRCRACLHTATALARRTARAGSKRRMNINDLFKAKYYSTLIGTAVFIDAKAKDDRRKEWDRAIGEAKAELSESPAFEKPVDTNEENWWERSYAPLALGNDWLSPKPIPKLQRKPEKIPDLKGNALRTPPAPGISSLAAQLKLLDGHVKQSLDACSQTTTLINDGTSDDAIWHDLQDFRDVLPAREPKTRKHVEKMQEMIAKLVTRLLLTTKAFSPKPGSFKQDDMDLEQMVDEINKIWSLHTPLPVFRLTDWTSIEKERAQLNRSISVIFQKAGATKSPNTELMLAKICYNLLVCDAPPGVQTYDLLLRSLTKMGQHEWSLIVASSFMEDSRYRPSFETIQYMLEAYAAGDNLPQFRSLVKAMRGMQEGLRTRRRKVEELELPAVMDWASSSVVSNLDGVLYEKAPRTPAVFNALIRGTLKLQGVRPTLKYIRAALRKGNILRSDILAEVVQGLLKERDYLAAVSLLRTISNPWKSNVPGDEDMGAVGLQYNAQTRRAVYTLISLCGIDPSLPLASQVQPHQYMPDKIERLLSELLYGSADLIVDGSMVVPKLENTLGLSSSGIGAEGDTSRKRTTEQLDSLDEEEPRPRISPQGYCSDAATILSASLQPNPMGTKKEAFISSNRIVLLETLTDRLTTLSSDISDLYKAYIRFTHAQLTGSRKTEYVLAVKSSSTYGDSLARLRLAIRLYMKERDGENIRTTDAQLDEPNDSEIWEPESGAEEIQDWETIPNMAMSGDDGEVSEPRVMEAAGFPQVLEAPAPTPDVEPAKDEHIGQVVVRPILITNNPASRIRKQAAVQAENAQRRLAQRSAERPSKIMQARPDASVLPPVKPYVGQPTAPAMLGDADGATDVAMQVDEVRWTNARLEAKVETG